MTTATTDARRALFGCPSWCTEPHDERDLDAETVDHAAAMLLERGGAFVGLFRVDHDRQPGRVVIHVDDAGQPERVADAVAIAHALAADG